MKKTVSLALENGEVCTERKDCRKKIQNLSLFFSMFVPKSGAPLFIKLSYRYLLKISICFIVFFGFCYLVTINVALQDYSIAYWKLRQVQSLDPYVVYRPRLV